MSETQIMIIVSVVSAIASAYIASQKGRNGWVWLVVGGLFVFPGVFVAMAVPTKKYGMVNLNLWERVPKIIIKPALAIIAYILLRKHTDLHFLINIVIAIVIFNIFMSGWSEDVFGRSAVDKDNSDSKSKEDLLDEFYSKCNELNGGVLNSGNVPDEFTTKQCNEMGILSLRLGAIINDLKSSNQTEDDIKEALSSVLKIEKEAEAVALGG